MRIIHNYIINKVTGKKVFTSCSHTECVRKLEEMEDKENYYIGYKWLSI